VYKLANGEGTLPSIVYMQESGIPLVGKYAGQRLIIDPANAVQHVKRFIGDETKRYVLRGKEYTPVNISAMILKRLVDDVRDKIPETVRFEVAGAIVTHPHYFKYPQIARTQEAAEEAGLPVIRLLSEPVAAALDYGFSMYRGLNEKRCEKILVFDLGGGTLDVTVLELTNDVNKTVFRVMAVGGDDMLGGTHFDEAFQRWSLERSGVNLDGLERAARDQSMVRLQEAVVEAKKRLSFEEDTLLAAANITADKHIELEVTRDQFNAILEPFCERVRCIVRNTMQSANLRKGDLDRTILVGGSSRIPVMRRIVQEETGKEPWANADPDLAVCRGAAILAAMEDGRVEMKKEVIIEEATSHALGVRAADDKFSVLIPANRRAPVRATRIYRTPSPDFDVVPCQGPGNARKVTDAGVTLLKPVEVRGARLGPDGLTTVEITFTVNEQQILYVDIKAPPGIHVTHQLQS
jgi:molecular chaperone DnaK